MKYWIEKYRGNILAHNTGWLLLSQGFCLCIQAAYFVIIARSLGTQQYGVFIAVAAFTQILSPFVGFGGGALLIKNVSRDRKQFAVYYGNLLFMTSVSGLASTGFVIAVARQALPASVPLIVIMLVCLADLIFLKLIDCAAWAFQAIERLDINAQLTTATAVARLIGIAVLAAIVHHPVARQWSFVYLLTTVLGATVGLAWVHIKIGRPHLAFGLIRGEFLEGLYFSASLSAQSIYNDIDKVMLARMASLDAVSIYAVAYRLIDVTFIPVRSLLKAAYPGFFRAGQDGMRSVLTYMRRLLSPSAGYSLLAFLCLFFCAPIVQYILGSQYARTVEAIRWLALLPLLKTIHYFVADSLTGAGYQGLRTLVQICVAVVNVLLNLWLIPNHSWRGAAWSSLASDGLLAVSLWCCAALLLHRNRPLMQITETVA